MISAWLLQPQEGRVAATELFRQRKFAEAAEMLGKHLRKTPGDFEARLLLGLSWQLAGNLTHAETAFRDAVSSRPKHSGAHYSLARVLYLRGRLAPAEDELRKAEELGEPPARINTLTGLIRVEEHRFDDAAKAFQRAMQSAEGRFVEPFLEAGSLYLKLNQYKQALAAVDLALERDPRSIEAARLKDRVLRAIREERPRSPGEAGERIQLREIAAAAGLRFVLENGASPDKHLIETMPGGVVVFDYDGDSRPDIFFTNGAALPSMEKSDPRYYNRLFRNEGGMRFRDVTEQAAVAGRGYSMGAAAADFDNDGHQDLFVAGVRSNLLYRNRGDGSFEEITSDAGISSTEWSVAAAWLDFDRDGLLDLLVVNYLDWQLGKEPWCGDESKSFRVYCHPRHFGVTSNRLYRNKGGGKFEDVSSRSSIERHGGKGMSAAVADFNEDGFPDIFVTNDAIPNSLFVNRGDGTFEEAAIEWGVAMTEDGKAVSGMGADARDYDNDARVDIVHTALAGETFPLFRNEGSNRFRDTTWSSGLGRSSSSQSGWSVLLVDLNNDGWKDLFSANSHVTDNIEAFSHDKYKQPNTVFPNQSGSFEEAVPFGEKRAHRGAAFGDFDGDGRVDVVVTALGQAAELWQNITPAKANWLAVDLEGSKSSRDGIGAIVRAASSTNVMTSAAGYASSSIGPVHLGLANRTRVDVEVKWPGGCVQVVKDVAVNRRLRVVEPAAGCPE